MASSSHGGSSARLPPSSASKLRVLVAAEAADVREIFASALADDFESVCVRTKREALEALRLGEFDVLVCDVRMAPARASELLALASESFPDTQRIVLTRFGDVDGLADAVDSGHVFGYLVEPWETAQLRLVIHRAAKLRRLEVENRRLATELRASSVGSRDDLEPAPRSAAVSRPRLLAASPAMQKVIAQVTAVAGTDASVLLHGETGTGKELIAAEIHERSGRRRARFVAQNLAALPPELMASELFGHVKGAFTGAQQARRGLFEIADGGTLFLDEIGEAPNSLQALLLRALESQEFWPVGASEPRRVDVRIVAATNRDLLADAHRGLFRLDLYYRLAVCPIEVPPLRARPEDVRGIGVPLLEAAARRMNRERPHITESAWRALEAHPWPGNVRELGNVMERLLIYHAGRDVEPHDLGLPRSVVRPLACPATSDRDSSSPGNSPTGHPPTLAPPSRRSSDGYFEARSSSSHPGIEVSSIAGAAHDSQPAPISRPRMDVDAVAPGPLSLELPEGGTTFDDLEREILVQLLVRADNNQSRAARSLNMSESTFRSRMKRLGLKG